MDLDLLYGLQLKEIELSILNKNIEQIKSDDLLKRLSEEYSDLRKQYLNYMNKQSEHVKDIDSIKRTVRQLRDNIKNYEGLKYSSEINNAKKLKMVEKQIMDTESSIKKETGRIEETEKIINNISIELMTLKKKLIFIKNKSEKTKNDSIEELQVLKKEQKNFCDIIEEMKTQIDKTSMEEYLKWKTRTEDPISLIISRKCTGCSVDVPSVNFEAARAGEIIRCESCGRVLLYRKAAMED